MKSPRSPCIVITHGWGLGTPSGVSRHVQELARALGEKGAHVILVCVSTDGHSGFPRPGIEERLEGYEIERELADVGVQVVRVAPHLLHWTLDGREVRRVMERLVAERRIDAVLGFYNEVSHLPEFLREKGVRFGVIASWLSYRMALAAERQGKGLRGLWMRRANRRFVVEPYRAAEIVFANSNFTRGELVDVLGCDPRRIHVTYLGVKPLFFAVPRAEPEEIRRFVFFGRLVPEKGIGDALAALGDLARAGKDGWTFRVMGSGDLERVRALARAHGIEQKLELSGHQGDDALRMELARAHVALLPSHSESFGLSIAEAQAAGLPVVAYAAGAVPEVVEAGKSAWLAPLGDVRALRSALEETLDDPHATWNRGLAGRERVSRLFRWEETAARVLAGLGQLSSGQPSSARSAETSRLG